MLAFPLLSDGYVQYGGKWTSLIPCHISFYETGSLMPCLPDMMIGVHSPELAHEIKENTRSTFKLIVILMLRGIFNK